MLKENYSIIEVQLLSMDSNIYANKHEQERKMIKS